MNARGGAMEPTLSSRPSRGLEEFFTQIRDTSGLTLLDLGGATQILFGIRGRRWDDHRIISKLYNEHWTRPKPTETPRHFDRVENGAYW